MATRIWVLIVLCVCNLHVVGLCASYGGGAGTETDPYLISSATHLQQLSANSGDWGKCFRVTADISGTSYTPVTTFTGVFDGDGHSISGFSYSTGGDYYGGFFCQVSGASAAVRNLIIAAPAVNVPNKSYVGAVAGGLMGGRIEDCRVTGGSITGQSYVGGIVGINSQGTVADCNCSAAVSGRGDVGGLVGLNDTSSYVTGGAMSGQVSATDPYCGGVIGQNWGTVTECRVSGNVLGLTYVGGLVGESGATSASGQIWRCLALGQVSGTSYVGGLVGRNYVGQIEDSYARGDVTPSVSYGGGLVGRNELNGTVLHCYSKGYVSRTGSTFGGLIGKNAAGSGAISGSFWDTDTSNQSSSDGGTGQSTYYMTRKSIFISSNWDFLGEATNGSEETWRLCTDGMGYPRLSWEWHATDMVCPDRVDFLDYAALAACWAGGQCSQVSLMDVAAEWLR
jgi:hypothetical protein